jgi:ribose-phosphate pyrophosphokinase
MNLNFYRKTSDGYKITDINFFKFSAGEVHIQINNKYPDAIKDDIKYIEIIHRIKSSDDIMVLLMVTDALRRLCNVPIKLVLPYLPYSRQDKISAYGESLSLKVFADIINAQQYIEVKTFDVHSDTSSALINNFVNVNQSQIIGKQLTDINWITCDLLISPDFGASKKIYQLNRHLTYPIPIVQCNKERDEYGKIIRIEIYGDVKDKVVLIIDDICDGGRTFIELAKVLKEKGAKWISLYVTHGIFSNGLDDIFASGIDKIFTTNTFSEEYDKRVTCIDVWEI